ncbi:beta-hexosaminidase subunit alpha-like [Cylas formicarius]|uniref:beta-hexosaminidase subunit alpha-like n=1 Tax=Cylas formicarius TaxID=197179 RepID=UPI00295893DD|nr:beta-hexosaminidase subunit alpha-like [Cylas formicarius]
MWTIPFIAFWVLFFVTVEGYVVNPGPLVVATRGEVWPKPQSQNSSENYFILRPKQFQFKVNDASCEILENAFERYWKILQENSVPESVKAYASRTRAWLQDVSFLGYIDELNVTLRGRCEDNEFPSNDVVEEYTLQIAKGNFELSATTIWGVLRGLETFSQLSYYSKDEEYLRVNATIIVDYPRFKYRGLLLDTSRHFIPLNLVKLTLDAMSYNKLNVFHWHIVDDQSFPYVSRTFPELSEQGAYNPHTHVYNPDDVQTVIEYGRQRGIRVLPEFDTPGHTRSWGVSHPELLSPCYVDDHGRIYETGNYGPIDPTRNETYPFIQKLFAEVREVFQDKFIHLGGDEVEFECWENNPTIERFMQKNNITTYEELESYYIKKVIDMVDDIGFDSIVWEEVFVNGVQTPNNTIIHVWRDNWMDTMYAVTKAGKNAILSACWYLDHLETGGDWEKYYLCEPYNYGGSAAQNKLIIGGEACMWGETINEYNVIPRVWPRASAVAERLWSSSFVFDSIEAAKRLEEQTCRMNRRGITAQPPNGPGFCE